jgi:mannose-1-phosphate guanylyltransferase/mannose-6-phosphate isomerase
VEKPDLATARRFLRSGRFVWNAGMFLWLAARFLREAERVAPRLVRAARGHLDGVPGAWGRAPRISVDHAVMERADGVEVVALNAGWDDVGSWDAAARLRKPGARREVVLLDSEGSTVFGSTGRTVALVGVPGVVVVDAADALLVVSRDRAEEVRHVTPELRRRRLGSER